MKQEESDGEAAEGRRQASVGFEVRRVNAGEVKRCGDWLAAEEPLELRVEGKTLAIVMRTPGHDEELAMGFLVTEGVIKKRGDLLEVSQCPMEAGRSGNVVDVLLGGVVMDWERLTRHVYSVSSCGLCGKTSVDAVFQVHAPVEADWAVSGDLITALPDKLRAAQATFEQTGGLHACALFDLEGGLLVLREDVGRHNALDKVIGWALEQDMLPLNRHVLLISGRVSFEMIQKALAAGIPLVAAISAPSSLAVDFARESGQTLVGFLRGQRFNVYANEQRVLVGDG